MLEKEMATHSSVLAWRIPGTEEPGRLQSMGSQRVRHDRAIFTYHRHAEEYPKYIAYCGFLQCKYSHVTLIMLR